MFQAFVYFPSSSTISSTLHRISSTLGSVVSFAVSSPAFKILSCFILQSSIKCFTFVFPASVRLYSLLLCRSCSHSSLHSQISSLSNPCSYSNLSKASFSITRGFLISSKFSFIAISERRSNKSGNE